MHHFPIGSRLLRRAGSTVVLFAAALTLSSCSSTPAATAPPATPAAVSTTASAPPVTTGAVVVKTAQSSLGTILVNADGLTLYGFTNDKATATSTCFGACAKAWPPLLVDENDQAAPEINAGIISTIIRTDGERQFVVGPYPVYTYVGDTAPGDLSGSGLGGVWFPLAPDGTLITAGVTVDSSAGFPGATSSTEASTGESAATAPSSRQATASESAPASDASGYSSDPVTTSGSTVTADTLVGTAKTSLGQVLISQDDGLTLYGFLDDTPDASHCVEGCAKAWPPLLVADSTLPSGLDASVFSVGTRADGTFQLKAGKWWLYHFAGDAASGDTNGQGSNGKWFAVGPDGSLIKS